MHLRRAFCLVAMLLFLVVPCVFAQSLLQRSLSSASEDELRAMAQSLGLDSTGSADDLLLGISEYFGVSMEPDGSGSAASIQSEAFGADTASSTSISIEHSDSMFSFGDIVVLSGGVAISFSDSSNGKKVLTADKVVIDVSLKAVEASGNVVLEDLGDASKRFEGGSVLFNWENMDIVVFNGISSTERKNAAGSKVSLYASGRTISYDGEQSIVFFDDGIVATAQDDPYWSIEASKVSFSGSDVFIDGALFKLGRVPILYFPFFFYPGTTLAFNPAIGLSSDKGRFINTTTELYGVYPKIGASSNSSSSSKDDSDSDLSASILSLLDSGDSSEKVRDGLFYRTLDDGEQLGALESWARSSKSYFAFFADAYEDIGLVAGYDTSNSLWDGLLSIGSTAAIAYNVSDSRRYESPTRYYVDFNLKLKYKDVSLSISAPVFSDYLAKSDLLNRNTTFGLDSVFGSSQEFPTTYSSQKQYSWTVDASASAKLGQVNLRLSSLAAKIDFELDSKSKDGKYSYEPKVKGASLPDLSFSSDASWTIAGGSSSKSSGSDPDTGVQSVLQYDNALAESFEEERTALLQSDLNDEDEDVQDAEASEELIVSSDIQEDSDVQNQQDIQDSQDEVPTQDIDSTAQQRPAFYEAPSLAVSTKSSVSNGSIKVGYTFNQVFRNKYADDLVPSSLYSKTSGSLYVNGTAPDSWFVVKETLKPQYSFSMDATQKSGGNLSYKSSHDVSFVSNLEVQSNPIGLTYRLSNKVYSLVSKDVDGVVSQSTSQWGEWNSKDVTEHSIEFKKSLGSFSFGIRGTLKPVKETIKPSVSFSSNGFTGSLDMTFDEKDGVFGKSLGNLGLGYSNSFMSLSLKNAYDFRKYDGVDILSGYSFVQSGSLKLLSGVLSLSESVGYKEGLMPSSMSFSVRNTLDFTTFVSNGTYSISFKGNDKAWNLDVLKVRISNSLKPIYFWRNRIGLELSLDADFTYSFANPYASSLTFDFKAEFAVAEFLSLKIGVRSANRSFYRYFVDGVFSFDSMLEDLARSFDFFGDGRTSTGFNMSSLSVEFVHYMRDWDLCMSIEGSLKAQRSGRYAWSPVYKVYVKWNAIPELKVERTVDRSKEV